MDVRPSRRTGARAPMSSTKARKLLYPHLKRVTGMCGDSFTITQPVHKTPLLTFVSSPRPYFNKKSHNIFQFSVKNAYFGHIFSP